MIKKIIEQSGRPSDELKELSKTGLLKDIFPELAALDYVATGPGGIVHKNIYYHTLQVLDNVAAGTQSPVLRWAAVLHDIGKPATQEFSGSSWTFRNHNIISSQMTPGILGRHEVSQDLWEPISTLVYLHMRPVALITEPVTDSAVRRLITEAGSLLEPLMFLAEADITSRYRDKYLENLREVRRMMADVKAKDLWETLNPVLNGTWIMENINLHDQSEIGILKEDMKLKIVSGIPNTPEALLPVITKKIEELGLTWKIRQ